MDRETGNDLAPEIVFLLLVERHSGKDKTDSDSEVGTLVQKMELENLAGEERKGAGIQCSLEALDQQIGRYQNPYESEGPSKGHQNHHDPTGRRHGHHDRDCHY